MKGAEASIKPNQKRRDEGTVLADSRVPDAFLILVEGKSMYLSGVK